MATPNWLNENSARAYPFIDSTVDRVAAGPLTLRNLPDGVVVDAGFVAGVDSGFRDGDTIFLARIRRSGDTFYFEMESDAPGLDGAPLIFTRQLSDPDWTREFTDSEFRGLSESSQSHSAVDECIEPLWWGYLVTGKMADLDVFLPTDGVVGRGDGGATLETSLVQNLADSYVSKFGIANDDRTRVDAPDGCDAVVFPFDTGGTRVFAPCVVGNVRFRQGFNSAVRQSSSDNSITFGAGVGAGAGEPCAEIPLFTGEVPPEDSELLSGGPRCNEVLRSINGVGGPIFRISAGSGVTVTDVPDEHELIIDVDLGGLAIATDGISQVSESC